MKSHEESYRSRSDDCDKCTDEDNNIMVSVSPKRFSLPDVTERKTNVQIRNKNPYPIYFKAGSSNENVFKPQPNVGRIPANSKIIVTVQFFASVIPIRRHEEVVVVTSIRPFDQYSTSDDSSCRYCHETIHISRCKARDDANGQCGARGEKSQQNKTGSVSNHHETPTQYQTSKITDTRYDVVDAAAKNGSTSKNNHQYSNNGTNNGNSRGLWNQQPQPPFRSSEKFIPKSYRIKEMDNGYVSGDEMPCSKTSKNGTNANGNRYGKVENNNENSYDKVQNERSSGVPFYENPSVSKVYRESIGEKIRRNSDRDKETGLELLEERECDPNAGRKGRGQSIFGETLESSYPKASKTGMNYNGNSKDEAENKRSSSVPFYENPSISKTYRESIAEKIRRYSDHDQRNGLESFKEKEDDPISGKRASIKEGTSGEGTESPYPKTSKNGINYNGKGSDEVESYTGSIYDKIQNKKNIGVPFYENPSLSKTYRESMAEKINRYSDTGKRNGFDSFDEKDEPISGKKEGIRRSIFGETLEFEEICLHALIHRPSQKHCEGRKCAQLFMNPFKAKLYEKPRTSLLKSPASTPILKKKKKTHSISLQDRKMSDKRVKEEPSPEGKASNGETNVHRSKMKTKTGGKKDYSKDAHVFARVVNAEDATDISETTATDASSEGSGKEVKKGTKFISEEDFAKQVQKKKLKQQGKQKEEDSQNITTTTEDTDAQEVPKGKKKKKMIKSATRTPTIMARQWTIAGLDAKCSTILQITWSTFFLLLFLVLIVVAFIAYLAASMKQDRCRNFSCFYSLFG